MISTAKPGPTADAEYATLIRRVEEASGLHFPEQRHPQIVAAVERVMTKSRLGSLRDYVVAIETGRAAIAELVEEVTVGETYFFREPEQFAFLRDVVLPEILARKAAPLPIRVWSAACATGEEPYSLAILLEEMGLGERGRVIGTDISRRSLRTAKRARYGRWSLRGTDAFRARRYLTPEGGVLALDEAVRERVKLQPLNLARDIYPTALSGICDLDLVLCRNVLIYFDRETVAQVAMRLHDSLAEGGWLVLGSSDPPLGEYAPFRKVITERGVFYRRAAPELAVVAAAAAQGRVAPLARAPAFLPSALPSAPPPALPSALPSARASARAREKTPARKKTEGPEKAQGREGQLARAKEAVKAEPLSAEAHYLYALVEMELDHDAEALAALRRALYLDRHLVMAHLALGTVRQREGDARGARRAFRTVQRLCAVMNKVDVIPHAGGACAAHIEGIAKTQDTALGPPSSRKKRG